MDLEKQFRFEKFKTVAMYLKKLKYDYPKKGGERGGELEEMLSVEWTNLFSILLRVAPGACTRTMPCILAGSCLK
jgi:hypothetical protein